MAKKIKGCFASTINRIPASVKCVSAMIVVLNAKFAQLLAAHANKKTVRNEKGRQEWPCFASLNTLTFNYYCSLHSLCTQKQVYYILFNDLYKLIKT